MYLNNIPTYARFQWLNHPQVINILSGLLRPASRGRKGYDKVWLFRWLIYKQIMGCSYRDLESLSQVDYSTFIKFRQRLLLKKWFCNVFKILTSAIGQSLDSITAIVDSSFVETYSKHDEIGSEYSGYKRKNGFKLHQIIDFKTGLPLLQTSTPGARADIVWGSHLIRAAPESWNVKGVLGDKAYDGWQFVSEIKSKWKNVKVGIPVRRTIHDTKTAFSPGTILNRLVKESDRCLKKRFINKRTSIERYFSRKKRVFKLGEERTRHLKNFRVNCDMTSIMEILEWSTTPA